MQKNVAYFMNKIVTNYFQNNLFYCVSVKGAQYFCIYMCKLTAILIRFIFMPCFVCSQFKFIFYFYLPLTFVYL